MKKEKYYYNPSTLRFEKIERSLSSTLLRVFGFLCAAVVFGFLMVLVAYTALDSPKERFLKNEISQLNFEYDLMESKIDTLTYVLEQLQERDNNIYRVIFEAEPYPENYRLAGIGGSERYKQLRNLENGEIIRRNLTKLELLKRKIVAESKSYDEISKMIKDKEDMFAHIPAIQPVANKDLTRIASGYGYRIHPIYKTHKMHWGIDFTAPTGTDIYATGDGVVSKAGRSSGGFGVMVEIAHGYGYRSIYGHLSRVVVKPGQRVERGQLIGHVGSTGLSTAPHLHYEIVKGGNKVNPINYFYHDLTDEEYAKVIQLAGRANQSFD